MSPVPARPVRRARQARSTRPARPARRALASFFSSDIAGGVVLTTGAVAALVWANSPWSGTYEQVWGHATHVGTRAFADFTTVQSWVNGGLMAVFFLVVGLEIAREHRVGELGNLRTAIVPVVGAAGGMVGAALVYAVVVHGGPGRVGWGIPMATDIAFALGALALLGRWVPPGLRLLLLTLAVADDIGSVLVLAVFYSSRTDVPALVGAAVVTAAMVVARRWWRSSAWPYLLGGVVLWLLLAAGGVEPALAGAVVGVLVPGPLVVPGSVPGSLPGSLPGSVPGSLPGGTTAGDPAGRLEARTGPVSAYVVLPLFALANAGVTIDATILRHPGATGVFVGIVVARVVGKLAGITLACLLVVRTGLGRLPEGVRWGHLAGGAAVAGIGFTVPLLIAEQAFAHDPALVMASQVGLLVGSVAAFVVGAVVLAAVARRRMLTPTDAPLGEPIAGAVIEDEETRDEHRSR